MEEKELSILIEERNHETVKMVVRHAHRPLFNGTKAPHEVSITDEGKEEAEKLGRMLRKYDLSIDGCASSPVPRCIQTAELIARGNLFPGKVDTSPYLGGSNLFNDDEQALSETLDTWTLEEIIEEQLEGGKVPGMKPLEDGLRIFMGRVLSDRSRGFEVFVSHDLFVCPAAHYLTETPYSASGNTGFLEGFFISIADKRTRVLWNGQWFDVTDRLEALMA